MNFQIDWISNLFPFVLFWHLLLDINLFFNDLLLSFQTMYWVNLFRERFFMKSFILLYWDSILLPPQPIPRKVQFYQEIADVKVQNFLSSSRLKSVQDRILPPSLTFF